MTDPAATTPERTGGEGLSDSALLARLPGVSHFDLEVIETAAVTPGMRRIRCTAPNLADLDPQPGQDLMLAVPDEGATFRRRYSIRRFDPARATVDLEMVIHGDGPGARWAAGAQVGSHIGALGPRGKVLLDPDADWHLFVVDESGIPAAFAMIEALGDGGRAVALVEVADASERQPIDLVPGTDVTLTWLERQSVPAGQADVLVQAVVAGGFDPAGAHAYVSGELKVVGAVRAALVERDFTAAQLSAKAYWRLGVANASHGEPERD